MIPIFPMKLDQTWDVNCGPRILTTSSGIPKYLSMCWNSNSAVVQADGMVSRGIRRSHLENRSADTEMVVLPWDSGRLVMKSMERWDQGSSGIGRGLSLPASSVHGTFERAHVEQGVTMQCTQYENEHVQQHNMNHCKNGKKSINLSSLTPEDSVPLNV